MGRFVVSFILSGDVVTEDSIRAWLKEQCDMAIENVAERGIEIDAEETLSKLTILAAPKEGDN